MEGMRDEVETLHATSQGEETRNHKMTVATRPLCGLFFPIKERWGSPQCLYFFINALWGRPQYPYFIANALWGRPHYPYYFTNDYWGHQYCSFLPSNGLY